MTLNFPADPQLNDEYSFGTKTWVYNGFGWKLKTAEESISIIYDTANAAFDQANLDVTTISTANGVYGNSTHVPVVTLESNGRVSSISTIEIVGGGGGGGGTVTFDTDPPASGNSIGDVWIDANTGVKFEYIDDGDTFQWVEFGTGASANQVIDLTAVTTDIIPVQSNVFDLGSSLYSWGNLYIAGRVSGNLDPITTNTYSLGTSTYQWKDAYLSGNLSISGQVTGNLIPSVTETFDLGSSSKRWKDLYISGTTINIGGAKIQLHNNTTFTITTHSSANVANPKAFVFTSNGGFGFVETTAGVISQNTSANIATTFSDSLMSLSSTLTHNVIIRPGRNHLAIGPFVVGANVELIIQEGGELTIV
jgi:hypothetical protein